MITTEEVSYAYKLFLGREPESADVIAGFCQNVHNLDQLSHTFMSSPEFMRRMGSALEKTQISRHRHPFNLPQIPVETQVSTEVLEQMFRRSKNNGSTWAAPSLIGQLLLSHKIRWLNLINTESSFTPLVMAHVKLSWPACADVALTQHSSIIA